MKHSVVKKIIIICIVLFCISFVCNAVNIILFYRDIYLSELDEGTSWQLSELTNELKEYDALDYWMKTFRTDPSSVVLPKDEEDKARGEWHKVHGVFYDNYSIKDISEEEAENKKKSEDTELILPLHACYVISFRICSGIPGWTVSPVFIPLRMVLPLCFSTAKCQMTAEAMNMPWDIPIPLIWIFIPHSKKYQRRQGGSSP